MKREREHQQSTVKMSAQSETTELYVYYYCMRQTERTHHSCQLCHTNEYISIRNSIIAFKV